MGVKFLLGGPPITLINVGFRFIPEKVLPLSSSELSSSSVYPDPVSGVKRIGGNSNFLAGYCFAASSRMVVAISLLLFLTMDFVNHGSFFKFVMGRQKSVIGFCKNLHFHLNQVKIKHLQSQSEYRTSLVDVCPVVKWSSIRMVV